MKDIVCFLGSLVLGGCIVLIIVDSCESLDLHVNGYTAEATVTENLRKSRARVQFTDEAGNSQTAVIIGFDCSEITTLPQNDTLSVILLSIRGKQLFVNGRMCWYRGW